MIRLIDAEDGSLHDGLKTFFSLVSRTEIQPALETRQGSETVKRFYHMITKHYLEVRMLSLLLADGRRVAVKTKVGFPSSTGPVQVRIGQVGKVLFREKKSISVTFPAIFFIRWRW